MTKVDQARVQGKIYFSGELIFTDSFVSVSSGFGNENTDSLVCRDSSGGLIIPATSFAGVLRRQLEMLYALNEKEQVELAELFGNSDKDGKNEKCSDIVFTDLYPYPTQESETVVQQGVHISREYLSAENKGKYDREIALNERFTFFFYIEKTSGNDERCAKWRDRLASVLQPDNLLFLGGRNSVGNGWGRFGSVYMIDYDFTQPGKLKDFLLRKTNEKDFIRDFMKQGHHLLPAVASDVPGQPRAMIQLDYTVAFQDAFLVNDPDAEPDENESDDDADFNFLTVGGRYTIPGSSIKGVFRHRSEMIAGTIDMTNEMIDDVFGCAGTETKESAGNTPAKKSAIYFSYAFLDGQTPKKKLMNGVSIDRFTGGAAEAALFEFKLLMNATFKGSIIMELSGKTLPYLPFLYLVIRDIREQDLSFGFGRTKGWGRAVSFSYTITHSDLPGEMGMYFQGNDFNLDRLENLHKENVNREVI
ncbi:MAG: RAMP superfamily CRISPR-associated protein [Candidatus Aminicenantes bacterium]|nr:RAMP superfamily CRISPR-associated protein [Candidatus Aminicenantes bacterium]